MNGTAQAATNASTIESGLGPSITNVKEQKQFPKKKPSLRMRAEPVPYGMQNNKKYKAEDT